MRIRNLQALRAFAALGVVFFHLNLKTKLGWGAPDGNASLFSGGSAGVDLFFVISGFIMIFICPERLDTLRAYFAFLYARFTRIFPPYWVIVLPLAILWVTHREFFGRGSDKSVDIFRSILLLPQASYPILEPAWTLIHEIYFYIVISFALILAAPGRWIFGIIWGAVVTTGHLFFHHGDAALSPALLLIFSPFSLTFLLGYFIGLEHHRLTRLPSGFHMALMILGVTLFAVFKIALHPELLPGAYPHNNHLVRFISYGIPLGLFVAGAVGLESRFSVSNPLVQLLGDASYSLYLVHLPVIIILFDLLAHFHVNGSSLVIFIAGLLICVAAGIVFHWYVERPLMRFSRNLGLMTLTKPRAAQAARE